MTDELQKVGDDIVSGIQSEPQLDTRTPGFGVTWIAWDSDFRRELRLGDLIVGVNGQDLSAALRPGFTSQGVGQYGESEYWKQLGVAPDEAVTLSVIRDGEPCTVTGKLHPTYFYSDHDGRPALAPGGPSHMFSDDDLGEAWFAWFEKFIAKLSSLLLRGWRAKSCVTRYELSEHLAQRPRIDRLLEKYPGPFADAMRDDWERARDCMQGKRIELTAAELEYRAIGERRVELAKQEAAKAFEAFLAELAPRMMPAFPAPSVYEREQAVGKVIELPAITNRDKWNDFGKAFAAIGSPSDGYYFLILETPDLFRFYQVMFRYQGQVNPRLEERYRYIGEIQDDPQIFTVNRRSITGLTIKLIGVLAGEDELFVDLRRDTPGFAGEDVLASVGAIERDDTSPTSVIEAMIQAIKIGDQSTWRSLFADWQVVTGEGGRPAIDRSYGTAGEYQSEWESSRRLITGEVYDARVEQVERIERVLDGDPATGLPSVDEVTVWVDHYGLFDGEYRAFQSINVNRRWTLQRLDGGPWKITSVQNL